MVSEVMKFLNEGEKCVGKSIATLMNFTVVIHR